MLNASSVVSESSNPPKPQHSAFRAPRTRAEALADAQWIGKVRYYVSIVEIIVADVSTQLVL